MKALSKKVKPIGPGIPGLTAKQISRDGNVCMYMRSDGVYEIFIVQVADACEIMGRPQPKREVYPNNEDFGNTAWCYTDKDNALRKYTALSIAR